MKFKIFKKLLVMFCAICFSVGTAFATDDDKFELDGNIINSTVLPVDWEDLFDANHPNLPTAKVALPAGFGPATFVRDFTPGKKGPDDSTFATGSKDTLDINGGWECTRSNNLGAKFNIINAYATAYYNDSDELILYFALERSGNEGDGNVGFWFLKDGTVGCQVPSNGKTTAFQGAHSNGDLFIVSEFSKGGSVSTIEVFIWQNGALVNTGVTGGQCTPGGSVDNACAIVNDTLLMYPADIPWLTETKQPGNTPSNDLDVSKFFEGGVNLTANNLQGCFSTFMGVTRSSTSTTATLFDYALGSFPLCSIAVAKTCEAVELNSDNTFKIDYEVTITNTGAGSFDASEDVIIYEQPSNAAAFFHTPAGTVGSYGDGSKLSAGEQLKVTGSYDSTVNGGTNKVDAKISLGNGFVEADQNQAACDSLALSSLLTIEKTCTVSLEDKGDTIVLKKDYGVDVCNTGDVPLVVTLSDNKDSAFPDSTISGNEGGNGFGLDYAKVCDGLGDTTTCGSGNSCVQYTEFEPTKFLFACKNDTSGDFIEAVPGGDGLCATRTGFYNPGELPSGTTGILSDTANAKATSPVVDTGDLGEFGESDTAMCPLCPLIVPSSE